MTRIKTIFLSLAAFLIFTSTGAFAGSMTHTGVVLDTISGGGYTYMQIEENGKSLWLAAPESAISKGTKVRFDEQIWMSNFKSKALDRTFDKLLFVGGVQVASGGAAPGVAAPHKQAAAHAPSAQAAPAPTGPAEELTVVQVYSKKYDLDGKLISVRGEVVKVSSNIMGHNWVHIKDGTGSAGRNKLVFRSRTDKAKVGSTVTARGRLETDVDFGAGYFYPVIIEDSTFTK